MRIPTELKGITHGRVVRFARVPGFWLTDVSYPPGARYHRHSHEYGYICFVLCGGFSERVGRATIEVESTTVVVMPRGQAHENRIGPHSTRSLVIAHDPEHERLSPTWAHIGNHPQWITRGAPLHLLFRIYRSFEMLGGTESFTVEELLFELLDAIDERISLTAESESLTPVIEFLHEGFCSSVDLQGLAELVDWDPAYLCRAFRRRFGCTIGQYVRELRARKAIHLAALTEIPLSDIAAACGFADQSHMTRIVTALIGMPPATYRRLVGTH